MRVIFRADGSSQIGLGHIVRSLALADMLRADFDLLFLTQDPDTGIQEIFQAANINWEALPISNNYAAEAVFISQHYIRENDIVVLDGYNFDTAYQALLKKQNIKLVCLDDIHAFPFQADVIINQAGNITPEKYTALPETRFCLGPSYAFLRQVFLEAARQTRFINQITRLFVNMGGADPANDTGKVLQFLQNHASHLKIDVVIGSANQHLVQLQAFVATYPNLQLHQNLNAIAMCALMQQCDAAVLPPSSVAYEWCSVGGPLFLHQTAANQAGMAEFLLDRELAATLATLPTFLAAADLTDYVKTKIAKQKHFFQGQSSRNLRAVFLELAYKETLNLRPASDSDMLQLYEWVNDPVVRQNSFQSAPIPLSTHENWYLTKLQNADCLLLIVEVQGQPAGMLRYEVGQAKAKATINYLLSKDFRGKGLGMQVLQAGEQWLKKYFPEVKVVVGWVQPENKASIKSFQKAGYNLSDAAKSNQPDAALFEKLLF